MDSSTAQHHQEMCSQTLESMLVCTKAGQDKKPRPPEQALKCPRCDSTNTKFCYYNNYSLTQPRYFCKSCRRYWTKGGTLRNVPVGGGCRKNRRSSSSSSSSSSSKKGQDPSLFQPNPNPVSSLTNLPYDSDISLALARLQKHSNGHIGFDHDHNLDHHHMMPNPSHHGHHTGFFDALRGGFVEGQNGFQNLYYGGNNMGPVESGAGVDQEMAMVAYDQEMNVKQEMGNESRVLWGFPWQVNGDGNMGGVGDQSSWNNGFGASWQGLLNSAPLM